MAGIYKGLTDVNAGDAQACRDQPRCDRGRWDRRGARVLRAHLRTRAPGSRAADGVHRHGRPVHRALRRMASGSERLSSRIRLPALPRGQLRSVEETTRTVSSTSFEPSANAAALAPTAVKTSRRVRPPARSTWTNRSPRLTRAFSSKY